MSVTIQVHVGPLMQVADWTPQVTLSCLISKMIKCETGRNLECGPWDNAFLYELMVTCGCDCG